MPSSLQRLLCLPGALLALTLSHALAEPVPVQGDESAVPISIPANQQWDGIDGSWSSFTLRVGTPAQDIRTFVSWNSYQTWGVLPEGCMSSDDYDACAESRGGIYNQTASTSFNQKGIFDLGILEDQGYYGNAQYGFDVVGLDGHGPSLRNTTVGGFALEYFWLGVFGINPKPSNFSDSEDDAPSYMTLLKEQGHIPSVSFGYTAGAQYQSDNATDAFGSLTLGGYDTTKFVENGVTWSFADDKFRDIVVAIQSIHTPSQVDSSPVPTELLPNPIYAYLDATVPEIWLPFQSCYLFEYEFGLTYDKETELYLVNRTLHRELLERNASVTFVLAVDKSGGDTVSIELPYASFDLTANSPFSGLTNDSYYFPLRRAPNDTTITLGRTFFQEAYLAVDYESQKFNVSQRVWNYENTKSQLVSIAPFTGKSSYPGTGGPDSDSSDSLSGGAIAGIVVGVIAIIALLSILLMWHLRRRKQAAKLAAAQNEKLGTDNDSESASTTCRSPTADSERQQDNIIPKAELPAPVPGRPFSDDVGLLAAGALSSPGSSTPGNRTPMTTNTFFSSAYSTGRWGSISHSPTSPDSPHGYGGYGTHSSTSTSNGPLSPTESLAHSRPIYEMAGDMPALGEKDGKELSEKEALAHREKIYNGVVVVETSSPYNPAATSREPLRRVVNAGDVVATTVKEERDYERHRAFSFEEGRPEK